MPSLTLAPKPPRLTRCCVGVFAAGSEYPDGQSRLCCSHAGGVLGDRRAALVMFSFGGFWAEIISFLCWVCVRQSAASPLPPACAAGLPRAAPTSRFWVLLRRLAVTLPCCMRSWVLNWKTKNLKIGETYELSYEVDFSFFSSSRWTTDSVTKFRSFILLNLMMLCFFLILCVCGNAVGSLQKLSLGNVLFEYPPDEQCCRTEVKQNICHPKCL